MGTAIIGIILILGVFGGISHAVDIYAPEYSGNETFQLEAFNQFEQMENINNTETDITVRGILDTIIQDTMGFVMIVMAILMGIVFVLILRLKDMET